MTTSGRSRTAYIPNINLFVNESWNDWLLDFTGRCFSLFNDSSSFTSISHMLTLLNGVCNWQPASCHSKRAPITERCPGYVEPASCFPPTCEPGLRKVFFLLGLSRMSMKGKHLLQSGEESAVTCFWSASPKKQTWIGLLFRTLNMCRTRKSKCFCAGASAQCFTFP